MYVRWCACVCVRGRCIAQRAIGGGRERGKGRGKRSVAKSLRKAEGKNYQKRKQNERKNKLNSNLVKNDVKVLQYKHFRVNIMETKQSELKHLRKQGTV